MTPYLPDELLVHIFSLLYSWEASPTTHEDGVKSLATLCLSSKRFRFIAEPILYGIFVKSGNVCDRTSLSQPMQHSPNVSLRKFMRTLIERSDLAAMVKCVKIGAWETDKTLREESAWDLEPSSFDPTPTPPSAQMARQFWEAASKLLPEGEALAVWLIALCRGDEDAEVALLLALLPNMEKLKMVFPNVGMDEYGFFLFHDILLPTPGSLSNIKDKPKLQTFRNLKQLEVQSFWTDDSDLGLPIYPFSTFFSLPQLEVFRGNHMLVESDPGEWGEWTCSPGLSSVQTLQLRDSLVSSEAIATLVSSCKRLHRLDVTFNDGDNDSLEFRWTEISKALIPHQSSLQSLSIDIFDDSNLLVDPETNVAKPLDPLKLFSSLQKLEVNQSALIGLPSPGQEDESARHVDLIEMLPSCLESFTILGPTRYIDSTLERLSAGLSHFPVLRMLRIESDNEFNPRHPESEQDMQRREYVKHIGGLFEAHGVEWVEVDRWPTTEDGEHDVVGREDLIWSNV